MTSGIKKALASFVLLTLAAPVGAEGLKVPELMSLLGDVTSVEETYRETKHVGMLDQPLVRTGTLSYRRPDYLRKESDGEPRELIELVGNQLRIVSPRGEREMRVEEDPRVRGIIASIRATLAGDEARLRQFFALRLEGGRGNWTLHLSPRTEALEEAIEGIVITGEEAAIREFLVREANGDRSRMVIPAP